VAHHHIQALILRSAPAPLQTHGPKTITPSVIAPTSWQSLSKVMSFIMPKGHDDEETPPNLNSAAALVLTAVAQGFQAFLNGNTGTMVSISRGSARQTHNSVASESSHVAQIRADCCLCSLQSTSALVEWIISLNVPCSSSPDELIVKKIVGAVQACYSAIVRTCSSWEDLLGRLIDGISQSLYLKGFFFSKILTRCAFDLSDQNHGHYFNYGNRLFCCCSPAKFV
jgi:hypothetical protein